MVLRVFVLVFKWASIYIVQCCCDEDGFLISSLLASKKHMTKNGEVFFFERVEDVAKKKKKKKKKERSLLCKQPFPVFKDAFDCFLYFILPFFIFALND
jgi:hypothetical protein